jgi:hypothetical protein
LHGHTPIVRGLWALLVDFGSSFWNVQGSHPSVSTGKHGALMPRLPSCISLLRPLGSCLQSL